MMVSEVVKTWPIKKVNSLELAGLVARPARLQINLLFISAQSTIFSFFSPNLRSFKTG